MNLIAQPVANTDSPASANSAGAATVEQQAGGDQHHRQQQAAGQEPAAAGREDFQRAGRHAVAFEPREIAPPGPGPRRGQDDQRQRHRPGDGAQVRQQCRQQQEQPAALGQSGRHDEGDDARVAPGRDALGLLQDHALAEQEQQADQRRRQQNQRRGRTTAQTSASGNSRPATQASRDIHERCGWRST